MDITIQVDDEVIAEAVRNAWKIAFREPHYRDDKGGTGWETVKKQVADAAGQIDARAIVAREMDKALDTIVRDVIAVELKAHVRKVVKEMKQDGSLFQQ